MTVAAFGWLAIPASSRRHLATAFAGPVDGSGSYRVDVAAATLRAFADRPLLGFGMGAYEDAVPAYKRAHGDVRVRHAESDALELLAEGGLAGLLLVGWLAAGILLGLRDRVTASRDRFRNGLALAAAGGAATLLAHSLVDFNLRLPANALVFAALAGLAAAPRTGPKRLGGPRLALAAALGFAILAAGSAWRAAGAVAAERALAERDPLARLARLDRALRAHPYAADLLRARAQAWRDLAHRPRGWNDTRLARAEADLRRALDLRPRWAEARADLGWVRAFRGDAAGARVEMASARRLDPTHLDVVLAGAELLARQGDVEGAIAALHTLGGAHPGWSAARARSTASRWTTDRARLERLDSAVIRRDTFIAFVARIHNSLRCWGSHVWTYPGTIFVKLHSGLGHSHSRDSPGVARERSGDGAGGAGPVTLPFTGTLRRDGSGAPAFRSLREHPAAPRRRSRGRDRPAGARRDGG